MQSTAAPVAHAATTPAALAATNIRKADLPAIGTRIGEDVFVGITRSEAGDVALFLNAANEATLPWKKALAWAAELDTSDCPAGTYSLPTRKEQALLFANAAEHFEPDWYWSGEQYSATYAWMQYFDYGNQSYDHKGYYYRVRAVRRLLVIQ
jgi:hypothetical protein